ncbi:MAG: 50S ribosomal protein L25, partial [Proteobacteria bacterium]
MTAAAQSISVTARNVSGKGEARRIRSLGNIPAVAYGKTLAPKSLTVSPKEVLGVLKSERGQNSVIQMKLEGADFLAMIKEYSYHPVTRKLLHVDFVEVKLGEPVTVEVPLVVTGKAAGVAAGGVLRQVYRTVPVSANPDVIPLSIIHDITELALGESLAASQLQVAEGVKVLLPADQTVVTIVAPEKDRAEDAAAAEAVKGAAPAKGAA